MRKKTKCYSKSVRMLELSILVLIHKINNTNYAKLAMPAFPFEAYTITVCKRKERGNTSPSKQVFVNWVPKHIFLLRFG